MNYKNVDKETYYRKGVFKHFTQEQTDIWLQMCSDFWKKRF